MFDHGMNIQPAIFAVYVNATSNEPYLGRTWSKWTTHKWDSVVIECPNKVSTLEFFEPDDDEGLLMTQRHGGTDRVIGRVTAPSVCDRAVKPVASQIGAMESQVQW